MLIGIWQWRGSNACCTATTRRPNWPKSDEVCHTLKNPGQRWCLRTVLLKVMIQSSRSLKSGTNILTTDLHARQWQQFGFGLGAEGCCCVAKRIWVDNLGRMIYQISVASIATIKRPTTLQRSRKFCGEKQRESRKVAGGPRKCPLHLWRWASSYSLPTMKQARRRSTRNKTHDDSDDPDSSSPKPKGHSRVGKGGIPQLNPFVEMLKSTSVEQAVPHRRVAVLDDTNTLSEALKVQHKIELRFLTRSQALNRVL